MKTWGCKDVSCPKCGFRDINVIQLAIKDTNRTPEVEMTCGACGYHAIYGNLYRLYYMGTYLNGAENNDSNE